MNKHRLAVLIVPCLLAICAVGLAEQDWGQDPFFRGGRGGRGFDRYGGDPRRGIPEWPIDERFPEDVFTFVRLEYDSWWHFGYDSGGGYGRGGRRRRGGWGWDTDYPDSDLNFSFRLQQLTSLKVTPDPVSLRITDDRLFDYPFVYMIEPGNLHFHDEEVPLLRRYLLNGGFMLVDDFWGADAWDNFSSEMKRVFPEREIFDVEFTHEIFHCVYDLKVRPQIPNIRQAVNSQWSGQTWEDHGPDSREVHYRGIADDKGRLMVFICHNTDLGDGWEREGEDSYFFEHFSQPLAYPMGINIVTYAMTH